MLLALFLAACAPVEVQIGEPLDPGDATPDDTGTDDTGGAGDSGGGDSGGGDDSGEPDDTGTPEDTGVEEPVTDFSRWSGARTFSYDYSEWHEDYVCDETVTETGVEVDPSSRVYDALVQECPDCALFYEVSPDRSEACGGVVELGTTWRGVVLRENGGEVHLYTESGREGLYEYAEDTQASFDGTDFTFDYEVEYGYSFVVDVSAVMTFPRGR